MLETKDVIVKEQLKSLLQTNVVEVRFLKKDGTQRDMICTLDPKMLPEAEVQLQSEHKYTPNEDVLPVWDLEKKGWRSFRIDSIISYLARRSQASW